MSSRTNKAVVLVNGVEVGEWKIPILSVVEGPGHADLIGACHFGQKISFRFHRRDKQYLVLPEPFNGGERLETCYPGMKNSLIMQFDGDFRGTPSEDLWILELVFSSVNAFGPSFLDIRSDDYDLRKRQGRFRVVRFSAAKFSYLARIIDRIVWNEFALKDTLNNALRKDGVYPGKINYNLGNVENKYLKATSLNTYEPVTLRQQRSCELYDAEFGLHPGDAKTIVLMIKDKTIGWTLREAITNPHVSF